MTEIWGIGIQNSNLDREFNWFNIKNSNFNDPDIIIINLTSLDSDILKKMDKDIFKKIRNEVYINFINGGTLIYIISPYFKYEQKIGNIGLTKTYSNFDLCPIKYNYDNSMTKKIIVTNKTEFNTYMSKIKESEFILHDFMINNLFLDTNSTNRTRREISNILQQEIDGFQLKNS